MDAEGILPAHGQSVTLMLQSGKQADCRLEHVFEASSFDAMCPAPWFGTTTTSCFKAYSEKATNLDARLKCFNEGAEIIQFHSNKALNNLRRFLNKQSKFFTPESNLFHTGHYVQGNQDREWFYLQNGLP